MIKHNPKRTILNAVDIETGESINAKTLNDELYANHFRKSINNNDKEIRCLECENELAVGINRKNKDLPTYYFYHRNNYSECDLVNGKLSKDELDKLNRTFSSKETKRHKDLKQSIYNKLIDIELVDKESVKIEKWFFLDGKLQRRPDVFCVYDGIKIAFEVQISDLSQRYMLERYNYYKNEHIHVIWIVDNFEFDNNRQFLVDIQELNNYQNIFKLDEISNNLKFFCYYPEIYLTNNLEVKDQIIEKQILFNELKFDNNYQVFYYDYPNELRNKNKTKEQIIKNRDLELKQQEIERQLQEDLEIKKVETLWQNKWYVLTKMYNHETANNHFLTEHCYFNIRPNEQITVFFPENNISQSEIQEIEENNSNLLWVINAENLFEKGEIRSLVSGHLKTLELNYNQENIKRQRNELNKRIESQENKKKWKSEEIERLEEQKLDKLPKLNIIGEIREKVLLSIFKNAYFEIYDLKTTIVQKFKDQLLEIDNKNDALIRELSEISKTLNTINSYKDETVNGKMLKLLPFKLDKNTITEHFEKFTIISKITFRTLLPEIVSKEKLPYVLYKPDDYVYLCDYAQRISLLQKRQKELDDLQAEIESEKLNIYDKIEAEIQIYLLNDIETLSQKIENAKLELNLLQEDYETTSKLYNSQIKEYSEEKLNIMTKYKGLYSFDWNFELQKWEYTIYPVFFDSGKGHVLWVNGEDQLKKIDYFEFINKLKTIKKTKKKWL